MTVTVHVVEIGAKDKTQSRGDYEFAILPSVGDFISETSPGGTPYLLRVASIRHNPIRVSEKLFPEDAPTVTIYIELVGLEPEGP